MFTSFFPNSRWFWLSVLVWTLVCSFIWFEFNEAIGTMIGLPITNDQPIIGLGFFTTNEFLSLYLYYSVCVGLFATFWFNFKPHRWQWWSILGSAFILFSTYYSVQVSLAINHWRRPFYDTIQNALNPERKTNVSAIEIYDLMLIFVQIAFVAVAVFVITRFFVSHYIFRWRTAMNDYYSANWQKLRLIEGASQRVQEDTMRFASTVEGLGVSLVESVMTLIAFLPLLLDLSKYVTQLPIIGSTPYPLVIAAIFWSLFGTFLLAMVGIKLPGLEFKNQRVEAAYRKELVFGEDDANRAQPITLIELFSNVRKNYFRLYFHYMYFNVARSLYLQADNIFSFFILVPTIAVGKITFGIMQQIVSAFSSVSESFQYLVRSWPTIVELLSVYKRLSSFEAAIHHQALPEIDQTP